MEYILIMTLIFNAEYHGAYGVGLGSAATVATAEFNSFEACKSAGEVWEKQTKFKYRSIEQFKRNFICAAKGNSNEQS